MEEDEEDEIVLMQNVKIVIVVDGVALVLPNTHKRALVQNLREVYVRAPAGSCGF